MFRERPSDGQPQKGAPESGPPQIDPEVIDYLEGRTLGYVSDFKLEDGGKFPLVIEFKGHSYILTQDQRDIEKRGILVQKDKRVYELEKSSVEPDVPEVIVVDNDGAVKGGHDQYDSNNVH